MILLKLEHKICDPTIMITTIAEKCVSHMNAKVVVTVLAQKRLINENILYVLKCFVKIIKMYEGGRKPILSQNGTSYL